MKTKAKAKAVDNAQERLTGRRKVHSGRTVLERPAMQLTVPVRELHGLDVLALGFKQVFFESEGGELGVYSGAGLGSVWVQVKFKDRDFALHVGDLLLACINTDPNLDPAEYEEVRKAVEAMGGGSMCTATEG